MSAALPREARAVLTVWVAALEAGKPLPAVHVLLVSAGVQHRQLVEAADWLERRGLVSLCREPCFRKGQHTTFTRWQSTGVDMERVRALLGGT